MSRAMTRLRQFAWASYDFANSTFSTSVMSVIFSVYFARTLVPEGGVTVGPWRIPGESLWGYLVSAAMAVVLVAAPWLGSRADRSGGKRAGLVAWAVLGSAATMAMFGAVPGRLGWSCLVSFLAILGFEMSLVFYNAFLNDLASDHERGRVSGLGFALGYVGGGLCLALNLAMLSQPHRFGIPSSDPTLPVRACMLVAGSWWLVFSIPAFFSLRDAPPRAAAPAPSGPFAGLRQSVTDLRRYPRAMRFLIAYLVYDDGIQTVILMASIFGAKALGMPAAELAACFLMIQFVAFVGALVAGRAADAWGHKRVVLVTLGVFALVTVWGSMIRRPGEFWVLGVAVGLVLGGAQAASRSMFSLLVPRERAGEFFAVFSIVGKAAALAGPLVFGVASQAFGLRPAVAILAVFFVAGGAVLLTVDEPPTQGTGNPIN